MLTIRQRKTYLKKLGYYSGKINSIEDAELKQAYKELQDDYFKSKKDRDGVYGKNTDILLQNAYKVRTYTTSFDAKEFRCGCGGQYCTGYPVVLDTQLLKNLQKVRTKFGATTITSGMRCKTYNNSLVGSSTVSRHMSGKAVDIYNTKTRNETGRKVVMSYWKRLPKHNYTYCNLGNNHPNMGNAVHVDVK